MDRSFFEAALGHVCVDSWRASGLRHKRGDKPRNEEKRHKHQYPMHPMDLRGHRFDSHGAAKLV